MAIANYQWLMLAQLGIAAENETRMPDVAQVTADRLGLSEDEREEMLQSDEQRLLYNRVRWAEFYMSKAGLIDGPRRGFIVASQTVR